MQILRGHTAVVRVLAFAPDGKLLASQGEDNTLRLWEFPDGAEWDRLEAPPYMPPSLAFSPDGRWLAAPAPGPEEVWVWDVSNPSERLQLRLSPPGREGYLSPSAVTFSPDGRWLVASGQGTVGGEYWERRQNVKALARRWQVGTWKEGPAADFAAPCDGVWRDPWALSPGGAVLATPDWKSVVFWDMESGQELFRLPGESSAYPGGLAFSPDGRRFAIGRARTVMTCDVAGRRPLATWKSPSTKYVQSLAFTPDGRTLATVSKDTAARLWVAATGRELAAYAWEIGPLNAVAVSADGMRAAVSGKKGTILVWDLD